MNNQSNNYKAHVCKRYGDHHDLALDELSRPALAPGEVLVQNRAFAIGFPDLLTIQGKYQRKPSLPFVPGSEFSGIVIDKGSEVRTLQVGNAVVGNVLLGAYAEQVVASASNCFLLPSTFNFITGAAFQTAYRTAYVGLVERAGLSSGETLLVLGATGGVGLAAVEMGRVLGARVIAAASSEKRLAVAETKGAHHTINYTGANFHRDVKRLTDGRGADVIFDPVGGDYFDEALHCIAPFGRLLVVGFASGRISNAPVNYPLIKQFSIVGMRAGEFGRINPSGGRRVNTALLELANAGKLNPHVHATYPFRDVKKAFDSFVGRGVVGRIVLTIES